MPDGEPLDAWLIEDAESAGPLPGADSLVLTGLDDYMGPPEGYRGPVRVHNGRRWLGSCREFALILPAEQQAPTLVLRGLLPGDRLRAALAKGARRALDPGETALEIHDDQGELLTDRTFWAAVRACLVALDDCLRGTFGYTAPATLLWRDAAIAHEHLSRALTSQGDPYDLFAEVLDALARGGMQVTLA
ncbi:hypothetical protein GCM10010277_03450 [Streptomyces longisporoflavus]|uniref:hypothetical protein n=1 Tax=Streptomyces longisporoflavus TaxID=28044 RepID=UPI0019852228|nr:hypothetical protein GCM10010277_03450 [Streptomyces longisporoflavus]